MRKPLDGSPRPCSLPPGVAREKEVPDLEHPLPPQPLMQMRSLGAPSRSHQSTPAAPGAAPRKG